MRQLMRTVLNTLGVGRVRAAMNVDSAIEELSVEPADAIFTDWSPTTSGIELVHRVRQAPDSPNPYMPVIIVSGYSEFRHVVTARDLGADEYLAKPISANLVYCRIRSLIEARRPFIRNEAYFGPDRRRRHIPPTISNAARAHSPFRRSPIHGPLAGRRRDLKRRQLLEPFGSSCRNRSAADSVSEIEHARRPQPVGRVRPLGSKRPDGGPMLVRLRLPHPWPGGRHANRRGNGHQRLPPGRS